MIGREDITIFLKTPLTLFAIIPKIYIKKDREVASFWGFIRTTSIALYTVCILGMDYLDELVFLFKKMKQKL